MSVTYYGMVERGGGNGGGRWLTAAITLDAGPPVEYVPTRTHLVSALGTSACYGTHAPKEGDLVLFTHSSKPKFVGRITATDLSDYTSTNTSLFVVEFTYGDSPNEQTWYAVLTQTGLF